jgi:hypothetical protein
MSVECFVETGVSAHLTSDLVSTARGVHAGEGLALLESGSGGGLQEIVLVLCLGYKACISVKLYLVAAVDRGVLSDAVNLVTGAVVDNVVR